MSSKMIIFRTKLTKYMDRIRKLYYRIIVFTFIGPNDFDCEHCPLHDLGCSMLCYDLRDILEHWDKRGRYKQRKDAAKKEAFFSKELGSKNKM